MMVSAAFGGLILAMIEGVGLVMNRVTASWMGGQVPGAMAPPEDPQALRQAQPPQSNVRSANFDSAAPLPDNLYH
jgi:hypothetical protein